VGTVPAAAGLCALSRAGKDQVRLRHPDLKPTPRGAQRAGGAAGGALGSPGRSQPIKT
jgi:hypothetical protein